MKKGKTIVVLYHYDCPDGYSAAWAAWRALGETAEYIPVKHQFPPPKGLRGKIIYLVDFSYPKPVLERLAKTNRKVVLIDHHIGSQTLIPIVSEALFDNNHSGAVLSWRYFHPKKPVPLLLRYIEDRDLFRFALPRTQEILLVFDTKRPSFAAMNAFAKRVEDWKTREGYIKAGSLLVEYRDNLVGDAVRKAQLVEFEGRKVLAVNASHFISEIGHALYKKHPPMAIVWYFAGENLRVSLRSNGTCDVRKLAERHGGGGHRASAAFLVPRATKFPWRILHHGKTF